MLEHYGEVKGGQQAGAVTYFGFLSFFPILALAFFVVGWVSQVYPDAEPDLVEAINGVLPGLIGDGRGPDVARRHRGLRGHGRPDRSRSVVLYAGLGWLSGMRDALLVMFEMPAAGAARTS